MLMELEILKLMAINYNFITLSLLLSISQIVTTMAMIYFYTKIKILKIIKIALILHDS